MNADEFLLQLLRMISSHQHAALCVPNLVGQAFPELGPGAEVTLAGAFVEGLLEGGLMVVAGHTDNDDTLTPVSAPVSDVVATLRREWTDPTIDWSLTHLTWLLSTPQGKAEAHAGRGEGLTAAVKVAARRLGVTLDAPATPQRLASPVPS